MRQTTIKTCDTCKAGDFSNMTGDGFGECHKKTPIILTSHDIEFRPIGFWPQVAQDDWCLEWERKPELKEQNNKKNE